MQEEQPKLYVWQEKSIFDFESVVCGECHKTELAVKASTDKKTMDTVHFAYISKNFGLWRSIVLVHKNARDLESYIHTNAE